MLPFLFVLTQYSRSWDSFKSTTNFRIEGWEEGKKGKRKKKGKEERIKMQYTRGKRNFWKGDVFSKSIRLNM